MRIEKIKGYQFRDGLLSALEGLKTNEDMLNALNVFPVPDGDTGTNMFLTMKSAVSEMEKDDSQRSDQIAKLVSRGALMGARGNSGVILSQLLRGFSNALEGQDEIDAHSLAKAFDQAAKVAYGAVMKPTEGTILTVARMMGEYALKNYRKQDDVLIFLEAILKEGSRVLDLTPSMLAELEKAGVVDAGGKGYIVLFQGIAHGIRHGAQAPMAVYSDYQYVDTDLSYQEEVEFAYCTEFIIKASSVDVNSLRAELEVDADSVLVVSDDDIVKVHLHTNHPGLILEKALALGPVTEIDIDNMNFQLESHKIFESIPKVDQFKDYGFVAVSNGQGINDLFKSLGVDQLIIGGQTMNPSTEDIVKAIEKVQAYNVFILPNNKNIHLAAKQATELTEDKKVYVIETNSIPAGFRALLTFDEDDKPESNLKNMNEALSDVKTLQVTYAVRDSFVDGLEIKEGNFIGLYNGKICEVGRDQRQTTMLLIDRSMGEEDSLITIFYGQDTSLEEAQALLDEIQTKYPDFDVELVDGGQPVYFYLISIE